MPNVVVKICGLSTPETLEAAIAAGADMAGFVFFAKSPRHIDLATARILGRQAARRIRKVALSVDADDAALDEIVAALEPDLLQLHGNETPARVREVKTRFGLPVIKAIGVATADDARCRERLCRRRRHSPLRRQARAECRGSRRRRRCVRLEFAARHTRNKLDALRRARSR